MLSKEEHALAKKVVSFTVSNEMYQKSAQNFFQMVVVLIDYIIGKLDQGAHIGISHLDNASMDIMKSTEYLCQLVVEDEWENDDFSAYLGELDAEIELKQMELYDFQVSLEHAFEINAEWNAVVKEAYKEIQQVNDDIQEHRRLQKIFK